MFIGNKQLFPVNKHILQRRPWHVKARLDQAHQCQDFALSNLLKDKFTCPKCERRYFFRYYVCIFGHKAVAKHFNVDSSTNGASRQARKKFKVGVGWRCAQWYK